MTELITFPLQKINQLRRQAQKAAEISPDGPDGWASLDHDRITVSFYTYSGYDRDSLYHHTDTYRPENYLFERDRQVVAQGKDGYIF